MTLPFFVVHETKFSSLSNPMSLSWSPTGKARGPCLTPLWGDIPVK